MRIGHDFSSTLAIFTSRDKTPFRILERVILYSGGINTDLANPGCSAKPPSCGFETWTWLLLVICVWFYQLFKVAVGKGLDSCRKALVSEAKTTGSQTIRIQNPPPPPPPPHTSFLFQVSYITFHDCSSDGSFQNVLFERLTFDIVCVDFGKGISVWVPVV